MINIILWGIGILVSVSLLMILGLTVSERRQLIK